MATEPGNSFHGLTVVRPVHYHRAPRDVLPQGSRLRSRSISRTIAESPHRDAFNMDGPLTPHALDTILDDGVPGGVSLLDCINTDKAEDSIHPNLSQHYIYHHQEDAHIGSYSGHENVSVPPPAAANQRFETHQLHDDHLRLDSISLPASRLLMRYAESRPHPTQVSAHHAAIPEPVFWDSDLIFSSANASATIPSAAQFFDESPFRLAGSFSLPQEVPFEHPGASANVQSSTPDSAGAHNPPSPYEDAQYQHAELQDAGPMDDVPDVLGFLERWYLHARSPEAGTICLDDKRIKEWRPPCENLTGEADTSFRDIQGLDWRSLDTDRASARHARKLFYAASGGKTAPGSRTQDEERQFYKFKRTFGEHRARFTHYQLRHTLAATSRNDIFYASLNKVKRASLACPTVADIVVDLSSTSRGLNRASVDCHITTIAVSPPSEFPGYTSDSVLVTGGFDGEYSLLNLNSHNSDDPPIEGFVTNAVDGITTHIHMLRQRRHGGLGAVFCSNDRKLRILDVGTNTWLNTFEYPDQVNCAATAPDGRLRVVVGDTQETLITDAERGTVLVSLRQHEDDAFACAWAQDGWHVATGAQDGKVFVYDARNWSRPVVRLDCDVGCARSLQFTECSGRTGSPALVVAETDDIVSIYDTRDWMSKQTIDFFGSVAGVVTLDGGRELLIANGDRTVGGLMLFGRRENDDLVDGEEIVVLRNGRKRSTGSTEESYWEWENQPKRLGLSMEQLLI